MLTGDIYYKLPFTTPFFNVQLQHSRYDTLPRIHIVGQYGKLTRARGCGG